MTDKTKSLAEQLWERNPSLRPSDEALRKWAQRGAELVISITLPSEDKRPRTPRKKL